jgi:hypothetical protein
MRLLRRGVYPERSRRAARNDNNRMSLRAKRSNLILLQVLRHSDINLTPVTYTRTLRGQSTEAVNKLPDLSKPEAKSSEKDCS